ncbi:MAG: right-handed parallel beta-helix repeat-containing protein [Candidatus Bipolaricaulia bacterium]
MHWNAAHGVIAVTLDPFPAWGTWKMFVDGHMMAMEGGDGEAAVRPNAPLDAPPTGLFIGTTPWLTPLPAGAFPCTGTLQFDIPGEGLTNVFYYDLSGTGCKGTPAPGPQTITGGTISTNTTWSGDVLLVSSVTVPRGVTLTILPGTVVRFREYRGYTDPHGRLGLYVHGTLNAIGTAELPIWFTSAAEDPTNGDWSMIRLIDTAGDCEIRFAIIEFGQQGLNLWNSSPLLSDLIVRWNNWEGIYLESYCRATIERSRIYQNGYNGIAMEQYNDVGIRDCYVAQSGTNGIHVDASRATIQGCIVENNGANGLSVDDHGILVVDACRILSNRTGGIGCGEGQNVGEIGSLTVLMGHGSDIPHCTSGTVKWYRSPRSVPPVMSFPMPDYRPYELGYIPGDPQRDRYMYVYPAVDGTRRVVNKIGGGLGLTWSVTWDGSSIWTATLGGDVYRLNPQTGMIINHWKFPGPQAWGMTWDGNHLWINDFAEKRVYEMTTNGQVVSTFAIPDPTGGAKGIAWDGQALCIMGWTSATIYRVTRAGQLLSTISVQSGARGGIAWDGQAFWIPGASTIQRVSTSGACIGSIYACSEGTWDLAWDGFYLWATQRTNENWSDAKLYQMEITGLLPCP